ncbi:MAG TPA: hypothetical protein VF064_00895 [Pyrinomonadaceae bacterium]
MEMMVRGKHNIGLTALLFAHVCLLPMCTNVSAQSRNPHRHIKTFGSLLNEVSSDFTIVEVSLAATLKKDSRAANRRKTYAAYTVHHADRQPNFRIYFEEKRTGRIYEIRGLPLAHRPFSDLVWANNRTLVFDRWSQPHYGMHYAVDVKKKRLTVAAPFPDEFYLEQQRPKRGGALLESARPHPGFEIANRKPFSSRSR